MSAPEAGTGTAIPWKKRELKYVLLLNAAAHQAFAPAAEEAFACWQAAGVFKFVRVYSVSEADLVLKWTTFMGENPNANADRSKPVPDPDRIATAQVARGDAQRLIWFNNAPGVTYRHASDSWWRKLFGGIGLVATVAHEIGHSLGLRHEPERLDSIMYPSGSLGLRDRPDAGDLAALRALYPR